MEENYSLPKELEAKVAHLDARKKEALVRYLQRDYRGSECLRRALLETNPSIKLRDIEFGGHREDLLAFIAEYPEHDLRELNLIFMGSFKNFGYPRDLASGSYEMSDRNIHRITDIRYNPEMTCILVKTKTDDPKPQEFEYIAVISKTDYETEIPWAPF